MKRRAKHYLLGMMLIIVLGGLGISYYVGNRVFNGAMTFTAHRDTSLESCKERLMEYGIEVESFKKQYVVDTFNISSSFQMHQIPMDWIRIHETKNADTVVLAHGLGGNRWSLYPIAEMFLDNGYNVVIYDQRASGENTAPYNTYGYWESKDLADCVDYISQFIDQDKKLGVWGISLGGATVGFYLETDAAKEKLDFAIMDCPVSNVEEAIRAEIEKMGYGFFSSYMLKMGDLVTRSKLGFGHKDIDVCRAIANSNTPLLIINSKGDTTTPYNMGASIYEASSARIKQIYTAEHSKHTEVFIDDTASYQQKVFEFIKLVS